MNAYINGIGLISPQKTTEPGSFLSDVVEHHTDYLKCIDPNYKTFIEPLAARRMSRLIKMGITSAKLCLADAGVAMPGAIITGTGLGSVEDTEKILNNLLSNEQLLNPTPFIQSTYNTISSQIAINLKCHNYNTTYVHRTFSFESCLLDALLQVEEKTAGDILVGGIDEMIMNYLDIVRRLGKHKLQPESSLGLLKYASPGTLAGEGSGYFLLSPEINDRTYSRITGVKTFYKPSGIDGIEKNIADFLSALNLNIDDIDIVLSGLNGDITNDAIYHQLSGRIFQDKPFAYFKHLCGEYHTASSFALWIAANCIRSRQYPQILKVNSINPRHIRNILIYNHYNGVNHSLILVSA